MAGEEHFFALSSNKPEVKCKCKTLLWPAWPCQWHTRTHTLSLLLNFATQVNNSVISWTRRPADPPFDNGKQCAFILSQLTSAVNDCIKLYIFPRLSEPVSINFSLRIQEGPSIEPSHRLCRGALSCGAGQTETQSLSIRHYFLVLKLLNTWRWCPGGTIRHDLRTLFASCCLVAAFFFTFHLWLCCLMFVLLCQCSSVCDKFTLNAAINSGSHWSVTKKSVYFLSCKRVLECWFSSSQEPVISVNSSNCACSLGFASS